ncbi:hydantoinase/oxoprolinase family protein [Methanothrix sp.]|uniref:hydantoinase/oxoprolinase family protein n=1 Tax=Methanothrix sp. TaxID=90426 RepID=UPI003C7551DA
MILGLDIGGANTKAASADGKYAQSVYLPLWKRPPLEKILKRINAEQKPEAVAVVITGELADCFSSKREGLESIMAAVCRAFSSPAFPCPVYFWGYSGFRGRDIEEPTDQADILDIAAANWSASAELLARELGDCLFVDMGSTTTDLIPILARPLAAKNDFLRLSRGELVYMGLLRTNLNSILPLARIRGQQVPVAPELFAIIADAHLASGHIDPDRYTCDTPDGTDVSRISSLRRLARSVCADLEEIGERGALAIAEQACIEQKNRLMAAIERQAELHRLERVAAAGIGEELIAEAATRLGLDCILLSELYGSRISDLFPAYAAARLLETDPVYLR